LQTIPNKIGIILLYTKLIFTQGGRPVAFLVILCYYFEAMLTTKKKQNIIKKSQKHDKDTGSPEVQIAILSKRIDELADHLKVHKKDNHSRRGLIKMVADRRTHLKSIEKKSKEKFLEETKKIKS
jgi:small subunit ribosomal protein S15